MQNEMTEEIVVRKPMTFAEASVVFNAIQKLNARQAILKKDRAKKSLTYIELLNKYAQLGGKVRYGKILFTFDQEYGMGVLITPARKVLGATIHDFVAVVKQMARG